MEKVKQTETHPSFIMMILKA